jgi:hypothetical protein
MCVKESETHSSYALDEDARLPSGEIWQVEEKLMHSQPLFCEFLFLYRELLFWISWVHGATSKKKPSF